MSLGVPDLGFRASIDVHSWKLTWKPKRDPIKTTVPLKWGYMGFHVSLGECRSRVWACRLYGFGSQAV